MKDKERFERIRCLRRPDDLGEQMLVHQVLERADVSDKRYLKTRSLRPDLSNQILGRPRRLIKGDQPHLISVLNQCQSLTHVNP